MKTNPNNKYFFNWASGTGGDFLIGVMHLLYPFPHISDIKVDHLNKWEHNCEEEDRLRPFHSEDMEYIQTSLNDLNPGEIFQYHQYLTNPLDIPKDTIAINLTTGNVYEESFIAHLYNIKCRTAESIYNTSVVRQSTNIEGVANINYSALFDNPTNELVFNLLKLFNRADAFSPAVIEVLKAYHQSNLKLLDQQINDINPQQKTINTFQELCDHFEI